eukprot:CAMPEP_0181041626 /NCGR_PEP_ID=MMETSP1070-20121207/11699_1 /TAXON_ID=265543 /ORGANISM="Minutocellus polymorphus, Strain NH13" /LENGTH=118 /DNA_ID=CAMNT_0023119749 /DNA_START=260 /DNA_END=617 /DNA_ORIENTATION=+
MSELGRNAHTISQIPASMYISGMCWEMDGPVESMLVSGGEESAQTVPPGATRTNDGERDEKWHKMYCYFRCWNISAQPIYGMALLNTGNAGMCRRQRSDVQLLTKLIRQWVGAASAEH